MRAPRSLVTSLLLAAILSCGDDTSAPLVPGQIAASGATTFSGVVGQPLGTSPAVLVTSSGGDLIPAIDVTFQVATGGGEVVTATVPTNATGVARVGAWILGPTPGPNTMTATVGGLPPVTFTASATAGAAARLVLQSGDGQSGDIGTALASPLVVRVADRFGNAVSGAGVTFAVSSGAGTLTSATATSDASGDARTTLSLTQPGAAAVTATSAAVAGQAVTFRADTGPTIVGELTVPAGLPRPFSGSTVGAPGRDAIGIPGEVQAIQRMEDQLTPAEAARFIDTRGRLVVTFRPGAFELPTAPQAYRVAAAREDAVAAYTAALAPLVDAGRVVQRAISPAIAAVLVTVAPGESQEQVMAELRRDPRVQTVEEDGVEYALHEGKVEISTLTLALLSARAVAARVLRAPPVTERYATDPIAAPQLWHYNMVDAPRTWVSQTGSSQVRIAIVDTGFRPDHPALTSVVAATGHYDFTDGTTLAYSSPQPVCGGLGTFQTLRGRAQELSLARDVAQDPLQLFVSSAAPTCWSLDTSGSHGSHVGGTIASAANDSYGGTGVNWTASLIAVRVLGVTGSGFTFDVAQGILYAGGLPATFTGAPMGTTVQATPADVINLSLGGSSQSTVRANAVTAASANSLIIASAGNSSGSASTSYPAAYPEVVTIAALDPLYGLASYTNVGAPVDLSAPGGDFRQGGSGGVASSTWNYSTGQPGFAYYQGTSMAAPHVTGVAALIKAANPSFTPAQVRARLEQGAVDLGVPGRDDRFGFGVVNAYNSVTGRTGPVTATTARLVNATTGAVAKSATVGSDGRFVFANLPAGSYFVVAGQDEAGDGVQGVPGRRFGWLGATRMSALATSGTGIQNVSMRLSAPVESEPNDDIATAQPLIVNAWVAGSVGGADPRDTYRLVVPTSGTYTFETSGVLGACGYALEVNTILRVADIAGSTIEENNDVSFPTSSTSTGTASYPGTFCSRVSRTLQPGTYHLEVRSSGTASGTYRLHVRSGT